MEVFMKRVLCLILVFVSLFALASCSGKKKSELQNNEKPLFEEEVVKEISAEEGGTVANSDGSVSIEIPADALESDTTITMRIYDAKDYPGTEDKTVISKVVEFEPSGTIFKKPVMISMVSEGTDETLRAPKKKVVTAAVYREEKGKWSYSPVGAAVKIGKDAAGDPIMMNAAGDPIMLNDNGDPIMMSAAGDPIMLSAAGDPIMVTAAGDPIMNSAAGDPIMMTTGHFTAYAFFFVEFEEGENKPVEEPTEEPDDDKDDSEVSDEEEDTDTSDTEISDEDDDTDTSDIEISDEDEIPDETEDDDIIVPEPEKVYSKVLCTGMAICTDGDGKQILCPKENEELYGQDAQYASRKGCVAHSYTEIENPEEIDISKFQAPPFIKDDVTGLTWWFTGREGSYEEMKDECSVSYGGIEDWRLPTPKELATLSDLGMLYGSKIDPVYFAGLYSETEMQPEQKSYYGYDLILTSLEGYFYMLDYGVIFEFGSESGYLMCVSGEKYGEVSAETYSTVTENGDEMILDSSTNLFWQKDPVKKATWKEALDYCESLDYAGHNDWRLPNKNELLSLVDYSKLEEAEEEPVDEPELRAETEEEDEVGAISSFPGMTPDLFWTSTPAPVDYLVWLIHMQYGLVGPYGEVENPEDEPIVGPQQPRSVKSIKRDEIAEEEDAPAVLCVRSDLDEKEETPECDGTGTGPCIDSNGTIWSSRLYPELFADFDKSYIMLCRSRGCGGVYFYGLAQMCRNLNENGSNKWRLPTIDEIRKTVTDEKLKFGGSCPVTDEHFTDAYFDEEACIGDVGSKTTLNDYGIIMSGTFNMEYWDMGQEQSPELWMYVPAGIDSDTGTIDHGYSIPVSQIVQRCVLDNTLDDYETAPYTDPETGIRWSELAPDELLWSEATEFCAALNEDDSENFWRLPTTAELQTLLRNCEEAPCRMTVDGRYSVFGDISYFWTSDLNEGNVNAVDFTSGSIDTLQTGSYYAADVRCVSGGDSACAGNPCASVENATGICITISGSSSEYECECDEESSWYDGACRQVAVVN